MNLPMKLTQAKRPHINESPHTRKNSKTEKTLENNFLDSSKPVRDVTQGALHELMTNQTTMLGELRAKLQAL